MNTTEKKQPPHIRDVMQMLEAHHDLAAYGLDWQDGERTLHEMWRQYPPRRFNSYAITSLYMLAAEFCPKDAKILDFGCATGFGSYLLAARTKAEMVFGVELDEGAVSWGKRQYVRDNLSLNCVNLHDPSLDQYKEQFDFVYCSNVMEHIPEYKEALCRVHELLKPGGLYFHVTPPSGNPGGNKYHVTNFKIPRWRQILEDIGFYGQRYFAHKPDMDRDMVRSEFDFTFTECGPDDMSPSHGIGSMSGIILAKKSFNKNAKIYDAEASVNFEG